MRETIINYGYNELQYVEYMYIYTNHVEMDTSKPRSKSMREGERERERERESVVIYFLNTLSLIS